MSWVKIIPVLSAFTLCLQIGGVQAQITNTVFFEDFESGVIDPEKFAPDAPFFEGGVGDISASVVGGQLEFMGTVSERWWAGATLRVVPTFTVSEEADVVVSVDRVAEMGVGTASRSALWIMDETQTKYVLFADVRLEGGWHYNRKIDEPGDNPTGGGANIGAFDPYDDDAGGGLNRMKVVANGETVRLYLNDIYGTEVRFPFSTLVFHVGSYARNDATDTGVPDTAHTIFDNLQVETVGKVSFGINSLTLQKGQTGTDVLVRIPSGANATSAIELRVVSSDPAIAVPVGAVGGVLTLTYEAGGPSEQTIGVQSVGGLGGSLFTLENDVGLASGNSLEVIVFDAVAGVRLEDDFSGATLDTTKWEVNSQGFETGSGAFTADHYEGALEIYGAVDTDYWPGISAKTVANFTATQELPLIVEVDRVSIDPVVPETTAARTGIFLTTDDRSKYIFFGQNYGETGWQVNVNPGNPTGSGTALSAFAALADDTGSHRLKLVADGEVAEVFLDGVSGGQFAFPVSSGLYVELGGYARAQNDYVLGYFDNVKIENAVPCVSAVPRAMTTAQGVDTSVVTVTIPRLLNASQPVQVVVTSTDPGIALPEGAVNDSLALTFEAGAANTQSFNVMANGIGQATLEFSNDAGACLDASVAVTVTSPLGEVFSDDFATAVDPGVWETAAVALDATTPGTPSAGSAVTVESGEVKMAVTAETANWPGFTMTMVESYNAELLSPVAFEVDRVELGFRLVTGTSAKQRTGVWIQDETGANTVFFGEYATWDGTAGGWQYNQSIGQASDTPLPAGGVSIPAFNAARFNDQGNHRMRVVVNGEVARLYLDDLFGAEVPFPFATNLRFGMGSYVEAAADEVTGRFDNAAVLAAVETAGTLTAAQQPNGDVVISWEGPGTLQSATVVGDSPDWVDVTPPPSANSVTVPKGELVQQRFYRLIQQ